MSKQYNIMENNRNTEPDFGGKGKENPFSVPQNYFESFPERLRNRLESDPLPVQSPAGRIWKVLQPQLALAAAIAGFAVLGYIGFRSLIQREDIFPGTDHIAEYIDFYNYDFSEYQLLSLLDDYDTYPETENWSAEEELYIDYLFQSDIDITDIISEF